MMKKTQLLHVYGKLLWGWIILTILGGCNGKPKDIVPSSEYSPYVNAYTGGIRIKWPNDIYWQDRKICGMLLENDLEGSRIGYCIAGIGININQDVFHSDAPNPVSLKQITGQRHDPADILTGILSRVRTYYEQLRTEPEGEYPAKIAARYRQALYRREGYHPYRDAEGTFRARLTDVEPDGRFVLEDETGRIRKYLFKEMQYVLNET